ncbi:MAG: potassium-transporting ATPase subunit KdpA, partial [Actinobacteria bacterium]|nr:potassium-transporting ATPase subunit KdpA [Actinomycetota bacterium]
MSDGLAVFFFVGSLVLALVVIYRPFGDYIAHVLTTGRHLRAERVVYRAGGVDPDSEQTTWRYMRSVLAFSVVSVLFLYLFLRIQQHFWPPYSVPQMTSDQAFNTAASFVTNTNWQSYLGESALGYVVQMA